MKPITGRSQQQILDRLEAILESLALMSEYLDQSSPRRLRHQAKKAFAAVQMFYGVLHEAAIAEDCEECIMSDTELYYLASANKLEI